MNTYIPHMMSRTLVWHACNGLTNTLPPPNLDITSITDPQVFVLKRDLFLTGSKWSYPYDLTSPAYAAIKGKLMERYGQIIFIPAEGEDYDPIYLNDRCRYESPELKRRSGSVVLMISDPDDPKGSDQLVVSPATYALAAPLVSLYDKYFFLCEHLDLEREASAALTMFLTSAGVSQSAFLYLAHLASHTIKKGSRLDEWEIVDAIDRFDDYLGRFQSSHLLYTDVDKILSLAEFHHREEDWYKLLSLWSILNNCSAWSHDCSKAQALLASGLGYAPNLNDCLKLICQPHELNALARKLTEEAVFQSDPDQCRAILLQILYTGVAISPEILPCITRCLFQKPMDLTDVPKLYPLRSTPNWDPLIDDIMLKVHGSLENGVTTYATALAALWICEIGAQRDPVLEDAQDMILNDQPVTALTGTLMLSMMLEGDLRSSEKRKKSVLLEQENAIVSRLLTWLRDPDTIHYNSAVILYRDLNLMCGSDCSPLANPEIIRAAYRHLELGLQNRIYVSILFSLLPLNPDPPDDPRLEQFRAESREHFSQLLSLSSSENTPEHFRACLTSGCWTAQDALANYGKLLSWAERHCSYLEPLDHVCLSRLKTDIAAMLSDSGNFPAASCEAWQSDSGQAQNCPVLPHKEVTSQDEAMPVIRYVADHCMDPNFDWTALRNQLQGSRFEIPHAQSFAATQWFYSLCLLGLPEEACDTYRRCQDLLTRPFRFCPDGEKQVLWPYRARNQCFTTEISRVAMGLRIAELFGHYHLIWGLLLQDGMDAKLRMDFFPVVDQMIYHIQTENRRILKKAFLPEVREDLFAVWQHYYDDSSITLAVLEHRPEHHDTILSFGYGGIKPFAVAAVAKQAESLRYISKELLRDPDVHQAATRDPSQVFHLMMAPVAGDHPMIARLLQNPAELCSPSQVHPSFLCNRDYAIQAMIRYPADFHLLCETLRHDKAVIMTAIASAQSGYLVQHILKHTDPAYSSDHEVIMAAVSLHPDLSDLAEKAFPGDPVLEALVSRRHYLSHIRQQLLPWEARRFLEI